MKRTIKTYGGYFERFIKTLNPKELLKLNYIVSLLETTDRMPVKFVNYIRDGLYEIRMEYDGCIVVLFNGFQKKTQNIPDREIENAIKIKEHYYANKR
ncbi:MAG: type II toxin-antitoxin system RelE/ParE family toxin [Tannerella sp.]|nr:type II toxin-antitoxin system RelE/ParE family toxin [Tannerella sp.]